MCKRPLFINVNWAQTIKGRQSSQSDNVFEVIKSETILSKETFVLNNFCFRRPYKALPIKVGEDNLHTFLKRDYEWFS